MSTMPARCPHPGCDARDDAGSAPFFWSKGTYPGAGRCKIRRYQCKSCLRHFSDQTGRPTWRRRRRDVDEPLRSLLRRGVSLRAAARLLGVNRKTVERRARDPRFGL